jgi:hypothetical protein
MEQSRQQQGRKLLVLFWMERIYVIDDESSKTTDEVEVYDAQTDSWGRVIFCQKEQIMLPLLLIIVNSL